MTVARTRIETLWRWAQDEPTRPVLTVGTSERLSAAALDASVDALAREMHSSGLAPGEWLLVAGTDLRTSFEAFLASLRCGLRAVVAPPGTDEDTLSAAVAHPQTRGAILGRGSAAPASGLLATQLTFVRRMPSSLVAPSPDASARCIADSEGVPAEHPVSVQDALAGTVPPQRATTSIAAYCRSAALFVDVLGITRAGTVLVALPPTLPLSLWLMAGLVHGRRHVVAPDTLSFDNIRALLDAGGIDDVVAASDSLGFLIDVGAISSCHRNLRHLISIGMSAGGRLRERASSALGRDLLIEYGRDSEAVEWITPPQADEIAGFWSWSHNRPQCVAVITEDGQEVSAAELRWRVEALAAALIHVTPPAVVACLFNTDIDVLVAYLASCRAGTELLPLNPAARPEELQHLLKAGRAQLVLTSSPQTASVDSWRRSVGPIASIDEFVASVVPDDSAKPPVMAGGVRAYTSGTTGPPKVVLHHGPGKTPEMLAAYEREWVRQLGIASPGAHLVTMPMHQLAPLSFASRALHAGQTLVFMRRWEPRRALDLMARHNVTSSFMAPAMFESLLALPPAVRGAAPASLRSVVHATATCPVDTKHAMMRWWGPVLYEYYGSTELVGTYATPDEWLARPGTVGRPSAGVGVAILNEDGQPCPPRTVGRVFLTHTGFTYHNESERPRTKCGNLVTVGDIGFIDEHGWLFLTGRETDYISVGGLKFQPTEIEAILRDLPVVADCAVVGIPQRHLGQIAVAAIVPSPVLASRPDAILRAIQGHARTRLPPTKVPARIVLVTAVPRDSYGKIRRAQLRETLIKELHHAR